jgi:uncharacterized protein YjbJ (UPF0337 family)
MQISARQQECFASGAASPNVDFNQMKETKMNRDILEGKWMQVRGQVKQTWGKLTDNDLDRIHGRYDELVGLLQERYGYARDKAEKEVTHFIDTYETKEPNFSR